jgi:radical SAM superfamily enzyme YgiQ (UPF0313 family)
MYKEQRFSIKPEEIIFADIDYAASHFPHATRLFLCDGDALILPQKKLLTILERIKKQLPRITRVGIYANTKSLRSKSIEDLQTLREQGVGIVYMGLESGDDVTLIAMNKGATAAQMIEAGKKAKAAGLQVSITVLLGIAGPERSALHAAETGRVLTAIDPDYVGALTLMVEPGTALYADYQAGLFTLPDPVTMLQELRCMIASTELSGGLFHANHASNYLPIRAKLPEEKAQTLTLLDQAIKGNLALKPEHLRVL